MKIKPLADRILVKNDKAETKTASGIIIPDAAQEKTQTASVVEIGEGTDDVKITVKVEDKVYATYTINAQKLELAKLQNLDQELEMRKTNIETELEVLKNEYSSYDNAVKESAKSSAPQFGLA